MRLLSVFSVTYRVRRKDLPIEKNCFIKKRWDVSASKFQGIPTWKCIPTTTACTNSDISALGIHDGPETWRDGGGTRTGLMHDRREFLEILFFTASTTFFTRTDFLLHGVVLSAVAPVALKRFTTFNMVVLLFDHPDISETSTLVATPLSSTCTGHCGVTAALKCFIFCIL